MSMASSLGLPANRRYSWASERFRSFASASLGPHPETRLQRPRSLFSSADDDVSTSISPTGWVAAATIKQVRLYNAREANKSQDIVPRIVLSPPLAKQEEIRAVALSEDLLAVVTHSHLFLYEAYTSDNIANNYVQRPIDQNGTWTPRSVSIIQYGTASMGEGATASVGVGGEGENGVKIFRYTYTTCWNAEPDWMILRCRKNNGAVKTIGFSPFRSVNMHGPMAYALTTGNQLYCWTLSGRLSARIQGVEPAWHIDCNSKNNERSYPNEISSATLVISPTGRPYIFCTVNHRQGSDLLPSFIVPVDVLEQNPAALRAKMRPLKDAAVGKNIMAGATSPNGHFIIVVEQGKKKATIKILTLQGAHGGGLTCATQSLSWEAKMRDGGGDVPAISISVEEQQDALEITVVDGRGHIAFARISVPQMPAGERSTNTRRPSNHELPYSIPIRELSSEESSRRSVGTFESPVVDRIQAVAIPD